MTALDSWFVQRPLELTAATRLRLMALVGARLALLALVLFIWDPEPRYRR